MRHRIAIIHREKCHPSDCGDYLCAKLCPVNRMGAMCITPSAVNKKAVIDEMLCTGCGICPNRCPFKAIEIINLPMALNKQPVHRYGQNMFELYSLPTPVFGQVVGILGKNGIGKSTALKVMANLLKPNMGDWTKEPDFKEVIAYFKGTEMQKFLEKLHKKEISFSYKPQQVDLIPKQFSGTVKELLSKVTPNYKEIVDKLQLTNFLDTEISKISGGELQRVAIAATVLKKANLFLFDEPSSYLDIKQRIKVSEFIRSLSNDNTAVMAIEHDLIILDYMTDLLNIMYGQEAAYGIVSGLKSTREGINAYLEGFMKEENIRFRDRPIKFENTFDKGSVKPAPLLSWPNIKNKFGNFTLEAEAGTLNRDEVIGVLGENGIGKTSFVKILAGLVQPDIGEITSTVKVAYKPQYLETTSKTLVLEYLNEAIKNFSVQLIQPLDLEKLFGKKLCNLSGGELQRVSIAHCLSQDAELFLLDEPSAYLDVEQRLIVSKVIHRMVEQTRCSAIVVDHDLLFLDYLSERLIVFDGVPAKHGNARGPFSMEKGMNALLNDLSITLRRDQSTGRPRINKDGSRKDQEQKSRGNFYYS